MTNDVAPFDELLEKRIKAEFGNEATQEFINMLKAGKVAYEHGYNGFISREKFIEWVGKMYDSGAQQQRVRKGEEHGTIFINNGDVITAGSYLSVFGLR